MSKGYELLIPDPKSGIDFAQPICYQLLIGHYAS
jgi:hypothetical protein